ncbi:HdeD family acid-resistance protein [Kitasatospora nipponensis]|uniref:HdeD family acid-resistance protein n=1 Tax=Kitasatospora nipponensis TaxID=258049 RepID=A0ABN1T8B9_9ACTN
MTSPTPRPTPHSAASPLPDGPLRALARAAWQLLLLAGLGSLALGAMILAWPKSTLHVVGVLFGIYLLVIGVVQLTAAFGTHLTSALRVMAFISGALCVLLGLVCFRGPAQSLLLLAFWIGIGWLFRGITQLVASLEDPAMPARGWHIFSGVVGIIGGVVVMVEPFGSLSVLTVFAGIWLVVMGLVEVVTALQVRHGSKALPPGA